MPNDLPSERAEMGGCGEDTGALFIYSSHPEGLFELCLDPSSADFEKVAFL